jgi:hypothetical protein
MAEIDLWIAIILQAMDDCVHPSRIRSNDYCAKCFLVNDLIKPKDEWQKTTSSIISQFIDPERISLWAKQNGKHTCRRENR